MTPYITVFVLKTKQEALDYNEKVFCFLAGWVVCSHRGQESWPE